MPGTVPPAQGVLMGEPSHIDDGGYTLRQQAERLPPGCTEHFRQGLPRRRCGGIAARYIKPKAYRGVEGRDSSDGACGGRGVTAWNDPAADDA